MIKKSLLCALLCTTLFLLHAEESPLNDMGHQSHSTAKDPIFDAITSQDLSPRDLQMLANAFYWSYRSKKASVDAIVAAKKNTLLAHNILFMTYNLEYAHDERVAALFNEHYTTWKNAHMMKNAQNACVGILTFKQEINDIANDILNCMCVDAMNALLRNKEIIFERAQQLDTLQSQCTQETSQHIPALQALYADIESQDINAIYPAIQNVQKNIQRLMHNHLTAAHTLHDIRTDIIVDMEKFFAQEFLGWYQFIYILMEERGLLDTPFGTIMCDANGLIEEESRPPLPRP